MKCPHFLRPSGAAIHLAAPFFFCGVGFRLPCGEIGNRARLRVRKCTWRHRPISPPQRAADGEVHFMRKLGAKPGPPESFVAKSVWELSYSAFRVRGIRRQTTVLAGRRPPGPGWLRAVDGRAPADQHFLGGARLIPMVASERTNLPLASKQGPGRATFGWPGLSVLTKPR